MINRRIASDVKQKRNRGAFVGIEPLSIPRYEQKREGVVTTRNYRSDEQDRFSTEDVLWALGIWSVILCLSPVVVFYVLMVA